MTTSQYSVLRDRWLKCNEAERLIREEVLADFAAAGIPEHPALLAFMQCDGSDYPTFKKAKNQAFHALSKARHKMMREERRYVIHSKSEGEADIDGKVGAFWSNEDGWGHFMTATRFTTKERMSSCLPISAKGDSEWMLVEEAIDLTGMYSLLVGGALADRFVSVDSDEDDGDPSTAPPSTKNQKEAMTFSSELEAIEYAHHLVSQYPNHCFKAVPYKETSTTH